MTYKRGDWVIFYLDRGKCHGRVHYVYLSAPYVQILFAGHDIKRHQSQINFITVEVIK